LSILDNFAILSLWCAWGFTTEKVGVSAGEALKEVTEEEHVHDQESDVSAALADIGGDLFELLLQGSHFRSDDELGNDLTEARVVTHHEAHELAFAASNVGAGEQQWGWELVGLHHGVTAILAGLALLVQQVCSSKP